MTATTIPSSPAISAAFKPGVYEGMSRAEYDAAPGINHTALGNWAKGEDTKPTRGMMMGSALHDIVFRGAEYFGKHWKVVGNFALNTKVGREAYDIERGGHPEERTLRDVIEMTPIKAWMGALKNHEQAYKILKAKGRNECSVFGVLEGHSVLSKGMIDKIGQDNIADLKTTGCVDENEFKNSIVRFGYASQAAYYQYLYASTQPGYPECKYHGFVWVCVSKRAPFNVWVTRATPQVLAHGWRWSDTTLRLYERYHQFDDYLGAQHDPLNPDEGATES